MQDQIDLIKKLLEDEIDFYRTNVKKTDLRKISYDFLKLAESSGKIKAYKELLLQIGMKVS